MSVKDAFDREFKKLPADLQDSGEAAIALAMASRIDEGKGSASECGKVAIDALTRLRDLAPPPLEKDEIDELEARRARRRAGGAGT